jgi:murein DD-endopeptidase MepM/ murein hydrolase activator NlpD
LNGAPRVKQPRRIDARSAFVICSKRSLGAMGRTQVTDMAFMWPIGRGNFWLSSRFGPRRKPGGAWGFHHGLDMAAVKGTPVKASADGVVIEACYLPGYGKTVLVAHGRKYRTRYDHLNAINVCVGQKVMQGCVVGRVGNTGEVRSSHGRDGTHLHFEVRALGKRVNPI